MKLTKVEKQLPSAQVNVTLSGKLKSELDRYACLLPARARRGHRHPQADRRDVTELRRQRPRVPGLGQAHPAPAASPTRTAAPPIRPPSEIAHVRCASDVA